MNKGDFTMQERREPKLVKFDGTGTFVEGVLVGVEKIEIEGKSTFRYTVQEDGGDDLVAFLGVHQINRKLRPADVGHYVAVRFTGEDKSVTKNGNAMKTFDVLVSKEKITDTVITDADVPAF